MIDNGGSNIFTTHKQQELWRLQQQQQEQEAGRGITEKMVYHLLLKHFILNYIQCKHLTKNVDVEFGHCIQTSSIRVILKIAHGS